MSTCGKCSKVILDPGKAYGISPSAVCTCPQPLAVPPGYPSFTFAEQGGKKTDGVSKELIKAMAEDIGKSLCAYVEVMFPEIWRGSKSGFKISLRNHVYNDIMSIAELHDEAAIRKRLVDNAEHRKQWVGAYRKMRRKKRGSQSAPERILDD